MQNVKLRCVLALFVIDAKEIKPFSALQCSQWLNIRVSRIINMWILCKSKVVANSIFCYFQE